MCAIQAIHNCILVAGNIHELEPHKLFIIGDKFYDKYHFGRFRSLTHKRIGATGQYHCVMRLT